MDTSTFLLDFIFGVIGTAYFVYGRKQQHALALLSGIALMIFPYFITNIWLTVLVGLGCMAVPFIFEV